MEAVKDKLCEYFTDFLPGLIGQVLIPNLKGLCICFSIVITGKREAWTLEVDSGHLLSVVRGLVPVDCSYELSEETFLEIAAGRLSPQSAFFARKIVISGDMVKALNLAVVMARFFREHPWQAEE